ncbi:MAG: flagellar filament capping protein FliD [Bdellovibrionales bacterium]|nr:flagellar filament capping protein FliD [Bdellovibrionales bacterium]
MGISLGSINTGLPSNIVDQLIEAEKIPIKNLEAKKQKQENKIKLVKDLETKLNGISSSLSTLASTKGFKDIQLNSGDPNIVSGVADPEVGATGSWNVEVVELAQKAAALTNGFPDKDSTEIGTGYFRFKTSQGNKDVYINKNNNTLEKAAESINGAGIGVRATVLNDRKDPDNPYRLVISGENVGGDNRITYPTLYFLDGDQDIYFEDKREAKNGTVKVDGFEFEINDNKVQDVIPGVTLELRQSAPGRQINVSVKENSEVVTGKVKTFVDAVNAVLSFIQQQNNLNKDTDTSQTLGGDGLLRSVENRLRRLIQDPQFGLGTINRLSQLGITFNRAGTLDYKEDVFNKTLTKDPTAVQKFLAGDGYSTGFMSAVKREVNSLLNINFGPVTNRRKGLQDQITQMDDQIARKERQLAVKEESLRRKFSQLEETMSRIKSQGGALAGFTNGAGPKLG